MPSRRPATPARGRERARDRHRAVGNTTRSTDSSAAPTDDGTRVIERLAGVDGCRAGWVVATRSGVTVVPHLMSVADSMTHLGIDMPIGLPARPGRAADTAARAYLGARRSSVFPAPARPLVGHTVYAEANAASRNLFGTGLSVQTFHLFAKIRDVDELVRRRPAAAIAEVHPECSFRALTGAELPSKHTRDGIAARAEALRSVFGEVPPAPKGAGVDDVLDALAVLWSTERWARGEHLTLPAGDPPDCDEFDIAMRIVV
jgi:predicted RNase H-like nuclease